MIKHAMTMFAVASVVGMPTLLGAQQTTTPATPATCDCPVGDSRGDLRNLAAFAPLGLLGALAAIGGGPALVAAAPAAPPANVAVAPTPDPTPRPPVGDTPITESARNPSEPPVVTPRAAEVPDPVSVDSLRAGLRAPNTGTPLPAAFLFGTSLVALGCVTIVRSRG